MYSLYVLVSPHVVGQFWDKSIMHVYTLNIRRYTQNKDVWALRVFFTSNCFLKD